MRRSFLLPLLATAALAVASPASAQTSANVVIAEGHAGYAEFIDSPPIRHAVLGGSARVFITQRLAIGPEVTWMRGPGIDRDRFFTGNVTIDLRAGGPVGVRAMPYIVAGAGLLHHTSQVGTGPYVHQEATFTAGVGLRATVTGRWFLAPEFRIGGDGHWRTGVSLGRTWN